MPDVMNPEPDFPIASPADDPIMQLQRVCAQLLQAVRATQRRASDSPACPVAPQRLQPVQAPLYALMAIMDEALAPALIESMAGSDAICIRGLTQGLAQAHADVLRLWPVGMAQPVQMQLNEPARDNMGPSGSRFDHGPCQAWLERALEWLAAAHDDVLPMAARLLDPTAIRVVSAACSKQPGLMQAVSLFSRPWSHAAPRARGAACQRK